MKLVTIALLTSISDHILGGEVIKTKVAILGGGMSGTMAARTLAQANISDFLLIEARHELGGRMMSTEFMGNVVELGANWVQGTMNNVTGDTNPIWDLALRYNLSNIYSNYNDILYFNESGPIEADPNIDGIFAEYNNDFIESCAAAGYRKSNGLIDHSVKAGLALNNWTARTPAEQAVEWWEFDWEYGQPPDVSSWVEAVNNYNYTFVDWSPDNQFVVDQRGFKVVVQEEASKFLTHNQILFNTTVSNIAWNENGVSVTATNLDGTEYIIQAEYVIITFSVGVLQHDAATLFTPELPDWKTESIQAFSMATYTKIFLSFPEKFWNDSQYSLYVDPYTRGRYAIWQDLALPGFLPDANITFVTTVDELSYTVEAQPETTTLTEVLEVLGNMYPDIEIPAPNGILIPKWYANPLFRGSYSNWPIGYPKSLQQQLAAPIGGGRVVFSGEATSYQYYGFLQGAYYEGIRAGNEVVQCLVSGCGDKINENILHGCNGL